MDSDAAGLHGCVQFTWSAGSSGQEGEGESVGQVIDIYHVYDICVDIYVRRRVGEWYRAIGHD